ncbi:GGDEF domain-containing protein [Vibrio lentus]|nr:GGDEF domain-containing protein [Vibrio lentus]
MLQSCLAPSWKTSCHTTVLARMGGDEFAVLIKTAPSEDAVNVCRSIISMMSENPFLWGDIRLGYSSSIGIRLIDHTAASKMVHAQADAACHAAKEEGVIAITFIIR